MRHVFGSRKRNGVGVVAVALVMAMVARRLRREQQQGSAEQRQQHRRRDRPRRVGGTGAIPGLDTETSKPTEGGSITYGLDADTSGGWCLPEAQLAIAGIQVARSIYDTLTMPDDKGKLRPVPRRQSVTPNANNTVVDDHSCGPNIKFSRRHARSTRRSSRTTSTRYRASSRATPLLFVFVFERRQVGRRSTGPMTVKVDDERAVDRVPVAPLRVQPARHHGRGAAATRGRTATRT